MQSIGTRLRRIFVAVALCASIVPLSASAKQQWDDKDAYVYLPKEEIFSGNFYRAGEVVQVDGTVEGDVIVAAGTLKINGTVTGDVIAAAGRIIISGPVLGDVRVAGGQVIINSVIGRNVNVFAGTAHFGPQSAIGYEALVFAGELDAEGSIKKDLRGSVEALILSGAIDQDVWLKTSRLVLQSTAVIGADLSYASSRAAQVMSNATIKGEVNFKPFVAQQQWDKEGAKRIAAGFFFALTFVKLLSMWLFAALLFWIVPKKMEKIMREVDGGIWPGLGIGLIAVIGVPVLAVLLAITVIGMPIAAALMALYGLAMLIGTVVGATYAGEWLIKRVTGSHWRGVSTLWSSLFGLFLLMAVGWIPLIGWLLSALVVLVGVGALLQFEQRELRRWR